jgi:hypothetical protein
LVFNDNAQLTGRMLVLEYVGNFHIHSTYSDGHKDIKEIASVAARHQLDFIIITDHGTLNGLHQEGYQKGILVLVGMEINDYANHYVAMNINKVVPNNSECPQQVIDEVNHLGGLGVLAHPVERGCPFYEKGKTYPWLDWNVHDFQGIEVWNFLSQWRDGFTGIFKGIWLLLRPVDGMIGPYPEVMSKVDQYHKQGKKIMLYGGSDAHGAYIKAGIIRIKISPYDLCFKMINIHIITPQRLTGDAGKDREMVYTALRQGRSWVACDYFRSSRGFRYELRYERQRWISGDKVQFQDGMQLYAFTPFPARVTFIRDGEIWHESWGQQHVMDNVTRGAYRVEVYIRHWLKYRPWIFTNPIWVE